MEPSVDNTEKMDLKTQICIWVILLGMLNFLAYTISYTIIGGESVRGSVVVDPNSHHRHYYLDSGAEVNKATFIYIGIHSISIWITVGAIMLAMLTLAKDRISDSWRQAMMRGKTLCTVLAVLIGICIAGLTFQFMRKFCDHFEHPVVMSPTTQQSSNVPIVSLLAKSFEASKKK